LQIKGEDLSFNLLQPFREDDFSAKAYYGGTDDFSAFLKIHFLGTA
jgi:hypothetical protein